MQKHTIVVNGIEVHYRTVGRGKPLLIVHGGGGKGGIDWRDNASALAESYTVYVPDLPGYGDTAPLEGSYFIPEFTNFLEQFVRAVGIDRFHLMGHSLGGGIALSYALKFPQRITKLVLVNSLCLGKEIALWVRILSNPKMVRFSGRGLLWLFRIAKRIAAALLLAPLEFATPITPTNIMIGCYITSIKEQTTIFLHHLSELVMPTLVVWGANDPVVPHRQAYAAARVIPDCHVKVFEGSGHSVYREKLTEFTYLLKGFLG
ncbi:alpha/beta fold hydrolase [Chloroflexota bacterium]